MNGNGYLLGFPLTKGASSQSDKDRLKEDLMSIKRK
jgi:hypothetical protein